LREQVEDEVRTRIVDGTYAPGDRLVEDRVAVELGVSRNPVREALRSLVAEGFVEVLPRRGAVVRRLTAADVADLFDVRSALESLAARLAAERCGPAAGVQLREVLDQARRATECGELDELASLNTVFHEAVVSTSGNRLLAGHVGALASRTRWIFRRSAATRAQHSWTEHLRIVEAVEAGDGDRAARLAAEHVEQARLTALREVDASPTHAAAHRPTA
jgi:DNA-binding GntR family transcriptional regulator